MHRLPALSRRALPLVNRAMAEVNGWSAATHKLSPRAVVHHGVRWQSDDAKQQQSTDQNNPQQQRKDKPRRRLLSAIFMGRGAVNTLFERTGLIQDPDLRSLASTGTVMGAWGGAAIVALGTMGIDTSPLVAAGSVAGIAAGFAIRDIGSNYAAGILLALTQPFVRGDWIRVGKSSDDISGVVVGMDLRHVHLLRPNNTHPILVPNSIVNSGVLDVRHSPPQEELAASAKPAAPLTVVGGTASQLKQLPQLPDDVVAAAKEATALQVHQALHQFPALQGSEQTGHAKVIAWLLQDPSRAEKEPWVSYKTAAQRTNTAGWIPKQFK